MARIARIDCKRPELVGGGGDVNPTGTLTMTLTSQHNCSPHQLSSRRPQIERVLSVSSGSMIPPHRLSGSGGGGELGGGRGWSGGMELAGGRLSLEHPRDQESPPQLDQTLDPILPKPHTIP